MEYIRLKSIISENALKLSPPSLLERCTDLKIAVYHLSTSGDWLKLSREIQITTSNSGKDAVKMPLDFQELDMFDERNNYPVEKLAVKFTDLPKLELQNSSPANQRDFHWSKKRGDILAAALYVLGEDYKCIANNESKAGFVRKQKGKLVINASSLAQHLDDNRFSLFGEADNGSPKRGFSLKQIAKLLSNTFGGKSYTQ